MAHVSRPLLGLLIATVAGFAVWTVALKKTVTGNGGSAGTSAGAYQSAIDKAHQALTTSARASAQHGGTVVTTPTASATHTSTAPSATPSVATAHATKPATAAHATVIKAQAPSTPAQRQAVVERALSAHKVMAILFYNSAATDDTAVKTELAAVPTHHGRVVKIAVPLAELMQYPVVTKQVPITGSPTLVLIDGSRRASTIVGFTDRFEISRRVATALTVK